jgi:hypothetical protein
MSEFPRPPARGKAGAEHERSYGSPLADGPHGVRAVAQGRIIATRFGGVKLSAGAVR